MAFVKLDTGILESTLWLDRSAREVFITALLMASPHEIQKPIAQFEVRSLTQTGWEVPIGWYGLVDAAGPGICRRAGIELELGMAALDRLGAADPESRSTDFEGRRLVRVDGGYVVLNYMKYRDRDHGAAERMRLYRARKSVTENVTDVTRNGDSLRRTVTYADADADAEKNGSKRARARRASRVPPDFSPDLSLASEVPGIDIAVEAQKFRDWEFKTPRSDWPAAWRNWIQRCKETGQYAKKSNGGWV
jgi:hypothetical protein